MALGDRQAQPAIVDQQLHARFQRGDDLRMRQVHAPAVARCRVQIQAKGLVTLQADLAGGETADPELGPLQVHEDADRLVQLLLDLANPGEALGVVAVLAVAEVQAEQVHAGLDQCAHVVDAAGGRAEGGEDLDLLVVCHGGALGQLLF